MRFAPFISLALPLTLAACGDLPQPFMGHPGATAARLAQPPIAPRLVVPPPSEALLSNEGSKALAALLARDLQLQQVPAYDEPAQRTDWRLMVSAKLHGAVVVPTYTVRNPLGKDTGSIEGTSIPAAAWAAGGTPVLVRTAAEAAPRLAEMLGGINTALQQANPDSLLNRPARVMLATVAGAPGDGDAALTRLMRERLSLLGEQVQDTNKGADFTVQGEVRVVPIGGRQERVEIQWIVKNAPGDERGRVVQLNVVPAGTLDHYWGDVAVAVAQEASTGVRDVILKQSGRSH